MKIIKFFPMHDQKVMRAGIKNKEFILSGLVNLIFFSKPLLCLFIKTPGKLRVGPHFVTSYLGNGQSIFDSLKSSPRLTSRSN